MDDVPERFNARVAAFLNLPVVEPRKYLLLRASLQPVTTRTGTCDGQHERSLRVHTTGITIHRCRDTRVRDARVRELRISDAVVNIEGSLIADGWRLRVDDARVTITSSRIEGNVAITAAGSHLDIAGCR